MNAAGALWLVLGAGITDAQISPADSSAGALFEEGRELLKQNRADEACAVFEQSRAAAVAVGTLLNLGLCHKRCGRLASALRNYTAAEELAESLGDPQRAALARNEAATLKPRVGSLTISVIDQADVTLEISIDGRPYPREAWGLPLQLDAGVHTVEAIAAGHRSLRMTVATRDDVTRFLTVPVLEPTVSPAEVETRAPGPLTHRAVLVPVLKEETAGLQRTLALGTAGIGALAWGAAITFAVLAVNAEAKSDKHCTNRDVCDSIGISLRQTARRDASWSTGLTIGGAIALSSGALFWLTLPTASSSESSSLARRASQ